jgi:hypothetical protein
LTEGNDIDLGVNKIHQPPPGHIVFPNTQFGRHIVFTNTKYNSVTSAQDLLIEAIMLKYESLSFLSGLV